MIPEVLTQTACDPDRVGIIDVLQAAPIPALLDATACVVVCFGDQVDPDQWNRLAAIPYGRMIFNARADAQTVGQGIQLAYDVLGHTTCGGDLQVVVAGERFHGGVERSRCGSAGKINGQHDCHTQRDGSEDQGGSATLTKHGTKDQTVEQCGGAHISSARSVRSAHRAGAPRYRRRLRPRHYGSPSAWWSSVRGRCLAAVPGWSCRSMYPDCLSVHQRAPGVEL